MNIMGWLRWAWGNAIHWLWRKEHANMDYSKITADLWQGGSVDRLPREISAVISLENDRQDWLDPAHVNGYLWLPIPDGDSPGVVWLDMVTNVMADWHERGWTILVHCSMGISRSSFVIVAYLMRSQGWTWREALEYVKARRSCVDPNPYFVAGLNDYQEHLRGKDSHASSKPSCGHG